MNNLRALNGGKLISFKENPIQTKNTMVSQTLIAFDVAQIERNHDLAVKIICETEDIGEEYDQGAPNNSEESTVEGATKALKEMLIAYKQGMSHQ